MCTAQHFTDFTQSLLRAMMMGQNPPGIRLLLYACKKDIYKFGLFPSFKRLHQQHCLWYSVLKKMQLMRL